MHLLGVVSIFSPVAFGCSSRLCMTSYIFIAVLPEEIVSHQRLQPLQQFEKPNCHGENMVCMEVPGSLHRWDR